MPMSFSIGGTEQTTFLSERLPTPTTKYVPEVFPWESQDTPTNYYMLCSEKTLKSCREADCIAAIDS